MKYKLFEYYNDGNYINESSNDLETMLKNLGFPMPDNIPNDGSWSEEVSKVLDNAWEKGSIMDDLHESITITLKVCCNENVKGDEPRVKLEGVYHHKYRASWNKDMIHDFKIALIGNKWYRYE